MANQLNGARVLVPRAATWGERVRGEVESRGGSAVIAPLIAAHPPLDGEQLDAILGELRAGQFDWVFITSASTVEQLVMRGVSIPAATRVAAVGRATARALVTAGMHVDFLPGGTASAQAMVQQWCASHHPESTGRCLVLRGDLAMAAVSDELELLGHRVDVGIAYRTVGIDLEPAVREQLERGDIDAVLLTAGSVARELHAQVPQLHPRIRLIAIGPGTMRAAEKLGLRVHATAPQQTIESMLDTLAELNPSESHS